MKISDWKDTAELIGIAAIVASLIFVGLQMKQSQDIAVAGQNQERQSVAFEYYAALIQIDDIVDAYGANHREHLDRGIGAEDGRSDRRVNQDAHRR